MAPDRAGTGARPMTVLAVIPARGGSKGILRKNLALLAGKPLIAHTIEAAKAARRLGRVVVSTDDQEIALVARGLGAEVIMRPAELATDEAPTEAALLHALETLRRTEGYVPDAVATLEPTSPLRTPALIDRCVEALERSGADAVLTVVENRACLGTIRGGQFTFLSPDQPRRRQERAPLYQESGTVYVTRATVLAQRRSVFGERLHAVVVPAGEAVDINVPADLLVAEALLRQRTAPAVAIR